MPESSLSAAVVGCGHAGSIHADGYERSEQTRLDAVCDIDESQAAALAADHATTAYANLETMLEAVEPDVVSVATGEYAHEEPTIVALEAGADVFCEKILSHSIESAERMVGAADRTGKLLAVNYNYRHMPSFRSIADGIDDGRFGQVRMVAAETHAYGWHHALDLLRSFLGSPVEVVATTWEDRTVVEYEWDKRDLLYVPSHVVSATFRFESGAIATVSSTVHTDLDEHLIDLSVYGDDGTVRIDGMTPSDTTGTVRTTGEAPAVRDAPSISLAEAFARSISAFVDSKLEGTAPPTSGEDGLEVMQMERAVVHSAERDRPVPIPCSTGVERR